jgi:hypothetical protein
MEILVFALVAGFEFHKPKQKFVPEPYAFQRFDVQTLKQVYNLRVDSSDRPPNRRESYVIQAVS